MAKPKTTKKKGPKGKKARAKAKLDRHWGESAIVDDEKPRRIGKSRLLARTKKDDERKTIRWASDDQRTREGETKPYSKESKADFQGALKNKKASFVSTKSSVHKDDESFSDSEIESDNEDDPPLQGLLRTIQKAKAKKEFPNRKANRRDPEEDSEIDDLQEDAAVDAVMEDCEGDNNEEDEIFLQSKDINNEDEFDDDDSVDEDGNSSSHKPTLDLFHQHFRQEPLGQDELQNILPTTSKATVNESVDMLLTVPFSDRSSHYPAFNFNTKPEDLQTLAESSFEGNRKILQLRWKRLNKVTMTKKQYPIYPFLTRYMDLFVKTDTRKDREELHRLYSLHILNHVLTSRSRIQRHNRQLKELEENANKENGIVHENKIDQAETDVDQGCFRDQGYTRPTVLVLLPTRGTCHQFVHKLMQMVGAESEGPHVERFDVEFGKPEDNGDEDIETPLDPEKERRRKAVLETKGKDWNEMFGDNVNQDDDFKVGVALTPKAAKGKSSKSSNVQVKLYTDFYKSDIIVASPLGLKMLLAPDEDGKEGDSDYLSSIEICLVQQADVQMMQNWDHANDILSTLNKEPEKNNDTDFSRVRNYMLEGQGAYWRQLIISTDIEDPFLLSAFKRFGKSLGGSVKMRRKIQPEEAALANVLVPMKQVFQRIAVPSFDQQTDARVNYFVKNILPQIQRHKQKHTMIYIPSYFDFVALRNIFLKQEISFVSVHEYSRVTEVSRARARFLQGRKPIMLFTGRCNFFHRHSIKGIRNLIFLGLPEHPQFYADQVNLINTSTTVSAEVDLAGASASSCLALFTKFEGHALERVVGSANCSRMLKSDKATFMFQS